MRGLMDDQPENRNLPVLARAPEARPVERPEPIPLSAPVAAATSGVLVGLATIALARALRHGARSKSTIRLGGRRGSKLDIAASRSFLVDVHMLNRR